MTDDDRRAEAHAIGREAEAAREAAAPIPIPGLTAGIEMLADNDRAALPILRNVQKSDPWQRLDRHERIYLTVWCKGTKLRNNRHAAAMVDAILGKMAPSGKWIDPPADDAAPADDAGELVTLGAEFVKGSTDAPDAMVAPGMAYEGRAVLVHAKRGEGKTTLTAWLAARATVEGSRVLVVGDDDSDTWRRAMPAYGANLDRFGWANAAALAGAGRYERAVEGYDWIIADNWRVWAAACGIADRGGFGNTEAAGAIIDRTVAIVRDSARALTILHNEGWSNDERSRDSSAVEDAVHVTRKVTSDKGGRITTLRTGGKYPRRGIDNQTRQWRYRLDESGFDVVKLDAASDPETGDQDREREAVEKRESFAREWVMKHPDGGQNACVRAMREAGIRGPQTLLREVYRKFARPGRTAPEQAPVPHVPPTGTTGTTPSKTGDVPLSRPGTSRDPQPCEVCEQPTMGRVCNACREAIISAGVDLDAHLAATTGEDAEQHLVARAS